MKVLICPDSFKGSCSAEEAATAIAHGVRDALADATCVLLPIADGGEGLLSALCPRAEQWRACACHDAHMRPIEAHYGITEEGDAVIEMATAAGLAPLKKHERNPSITTTYGVGELIRAACEQGIDRIILGIGGSATNDAGCGMAQALGYRFYTEEGRLLPDGIAGKDLQTIARIDDTQCIPALHACRVDVACDVTNPLYGADGAAYTYARQKGADDAAIARLDAGLRHVAPLLSRCAGTDVATLSGAGSAGGMGAGAVAFLRAHLRPGIDLVLDARHFDEHLHNTALVISGEGHIDAQTTWGKALAGIYARCKKHGVALIACAGYVDENATHPFPTFGIVNNGVDTDAAMADPHTHLRTLVRTVLRTHGDALFTLTSSEQ